MKSAHGKFAAALTLLVLAFTAAQFLITAAQAQSSGSIQADFLSLINAERASHGKTPLVASSQLESAAYLHSKDMGDNDYFDHTSQDGTRFSQRITNAGYNWVSCAENIAIAYGAPNAAKVYDMWKNSAGHYANMIGNYADAGLGVYTVDGYTYYTLDLGRSQSSPTQTPKPTGSPTPTPHPTATSTPTPSPTVTPTPTPTLTIRPTTPTPTPTQLPTATPTPDPATTATPTTTTTLTPNPQTTTTPSSTSKTSTQTASTPKPSTATVQPNPTPTTPEYSLTLLLTATLLIAIGVVVKHILKQ